MEGTYPSCRTAAARHAAVELPELNFAAVSKCGAGHANKLEGEGTPKIALILRFLRVPSLYRDIARYPATFLVDRKGRLQSAPGPSQPFEKTHAVVNSLLNEGSD